jgi:hypothetical protein
MPLARYWCKCIVPQAIPRQVEELLPKNPTQTKEQRKFPEANRFREFLEATIVFPESLYPLQTPVNTLRLLAESNTT